MVVSRSTGWLAKVVNGEILGDEATIFRTLSTDSRSILHSEGAMFAAISGKRHNGNDYISEVYAKGVRCFLVEKRPDLSSFPGATFCLVKDSLEALQTMASEIRRDFEGEVIGITGSNGKTIVKEWLYQVLQHDRKVIRSPRSYNSQLGVPLSIWPLDNQYELAIIEAGISEAGEMGRLEKMISPSIGILTNIGSAHSENFTSDLQKLAEKLQLFKHTGKLIYNADLLVNGKRIQTLMETFKGEKVGWSKDGNGKYSISQSSQQNGTVALDIEYHEGNCSFVVPFTDDASLENISHVIVCLLELDVHREKIEVYLKQLEPVEMRLQILKGVHGSTLINDAYNSDLAGLNRALDVLVQQSQHPSRAIIISDLFQSGLDDEELYREVADLLKINHIDRVYGIGQSISKFSHFFPEGALFYKNTNRFLRDFNSSEIGNYAVLVKGARQFQFERISAELQLQAHQTVLEINVNALIDNLNYFKSLLSSETRIMVMVKALSYGSGTYEIAGLLQHEQVDSLSVAFSDEGIELRNAGIHLPIMVMNPGVRDFQLIIENDLEPVIFHLEGLERFIQVCSFNGLVDYPVHIKIDSGMHRLGFSEEQTDDLISRLSGNELIVKSIFSHLAGSDEEQLDEFTEEQAERFLQMVEKIEDHIGYRSRRHILNSAGAERFPQYHMDMVRVGIGLYGQGFSERLMPVSTFKTVISQVKHLKKGETVGYSRSGKLEKDSVIAVIPVGYADGLDRRLGNGNISFFVNGSMVKTVGNICMDMTMIDVTDVDATIGDVVELFGKECSVSAMADRLGTIPYEILTGIPERVKRVYIRE